MTNSALPGVLGILPPKDDAILPAAAGSSTALISPGKPASFNNKAKASRAAAAASERWDAKPASSSCSNKLAKPGRADAAERWDAHKKDTSLGKRPISSASSWSDSSSSTRSNKKQQCAAPSAWKRKQDDNRNGCKRPFFSSRSSSSDERWDAHKKPRTVMGRDEDDKEAVLSISKLTTTTVPPYAGPAFLNSPEPCMLPIPTFLIMPFAQAT